MERRNRVALEAPTDYSPATNESEEASKFPRSCGPFFSAGGVRNSSSSIGK